MRKEIVARVSHRGCGSFELPFVNGHLHESCIPDACKPVEVDEVHILFDKDHLFTVKTSSLKNAGYGLFAARDFKHHEQIGIYWGKIVADDSNMSHEEFEMASEYTLSINEAKLKKFQKGFMIIGSPYKGGNSNVGYFGMHMMNDPAHSQTPIAANVTIEADAVAVTTREIEAGEELFYNYNRAEHKEGYTRGGGKKRKDDASDGAAAKKSKKDDGDDDKPGDDDKDDEEPEEGGTMEEEVEKDKPVWMNSVAGRRVFKSHNRQWDWGGIAFVGKEYVVEFQGGAETWRGPKEHAQLFLKDWTILWDFGTEGLWTGQVWSYYAASKLFVVVFRDGQWVTLTKASVEDGIKAWKEKDENWHENQRQKEVAECKKKKKKSAVKSD